MLAWTVSLPGHPPCFWEPHPWSVSSPCGGAVAEIQCPAKKAEQGVPKDSDMVSWPPLNGLDNHETPLQDITFSVALPPMGAYMHGCWVLTDGERH